MRKSIEQLLIEYPSWNTDKHDIVKSLYGDEPSSKWDRNRYMDFLTLTGTLANIQAVDAYIYSQYGNYYIYNTFIGKVYISEKGNVLAGDVNVHYKGCNSVILNKMYGRNALDILKLGQNVVGFSNKDGQGSPSRYTKEMNKETIEKVINCPLEDYGIGIQKFMEEVRKTYEIDPGNHIMDKLFGR